MKHVPVDFRILGETADLLAVDKPAGLLVHPTKPGGPRTLWDGLRDLLGYELVNGGQVSIVNRLDRETSGAVLVCKNAAAARFCSMAMERRAIHKEYLAITHGWPELDEFSVDAPILRLGGVAPSAVWLKRAVHEQGAPSVTGFQVLERRISTDGRKIAIVRAHPFTGRTHQIRVHLSHAGYPVVGDKLYGAGEEYYLRFVETGWTEELERVLWLSRHALHSARMGLEYGGSTHEWKSPLPEDLGAFLAGFKACDLGVPQ